jgi:WD40 repeat protein
VVALAKGVLKTMFLTKLKIVAELTLVALAVTLGAEFVVAGQDPPARDEKPAPQVEKDPRERATVDAGLPGTQVFALSADGSRLFGGGSGGIQVWEVKTGNHLFTILVDRIDLTMARFNLPRCPIVVAPDGKSLIVADPSAGAKVWDLSGDEPKVKRWISWPQPMADPDTGEEVGFRVTSVALSSDAQRLLTLKSNGEISIWDLTTGEKVFTFRKQIAQDSLLALSPDGKTIAGIIDGTPHLWDASTGKEVKKIQTKKPSSHRPEVLRFSDDGKTLMAGSNEGTQLWDVENGKEGRMIRGSNLSPRSTVLSHDGKMLAIAASGQKVKTVDVATGKEVTMYRWVSSGLSSVAISRDGKTIASSREGRIRVWSVTRPDEQK